MVVKILAIVTQIKILAVIPSCKAGLCSRPANKANETMLFSSDRTPKAWDRAPLRLMLKKSEIKIVAIEINNRSWLEGDRKISGLKKLAWVRMERSTMTATVKGVLRKVLWEKFDGWRLISFRKKYGAKTTLTAMVAIMAIKSNKDSFWKEERSNKMAMAAD